MIRHVRKDGNLHMKISEVKMPEHEYNEKYDILIRPYLKSEDIVSIGETALTMDNLAEIDACVAYNVIAITTDIKEEELDELTIDNILYGGLWEEVAPYIKNLADVYDYIQYEQNASIAVAKFVNRVLPTLLEGLDGQLSEYLEKMSDKGIDNISDELAKIMDMVKEDGNAEIIKGALKMGGDE